MEFFQIEDTGGKRGKIRNVPVFCSHTGEWNGIKYAVDQLWLDRCVQDFEKRKRDSTIDGQEKYAHCPTVTIGHPSDDSIDTAKTPAVGFCTELCRYEDLLVADWEVDREVYAEIKANKFPSRSADIGLFQNRLKNVSLLGGHAPKLPLPQMRFADKEFVVQCADDSGTLRCEMKTWEFPGSKELIMPEQLNQMADALIPLLMPRLEAALKQKQVEAVANAQPAAAAYADDKDTLKNAEPAKTPPPPPMPTDETTKFAEENISLKKQVSLLSADVDKLAKGTRRQAAVSELTKLALSGYAIGSDEDVQKFADDLADMEPELAKRMLKRLEATSPKIETKRVEGKPQVIAPPGGDALAKFAEGNEDLEKMLLALGSHEKADEAARYAELLGRP